MSKRLSKSEKVKQEKAALKRRLLDMAAGAYGDFNPLDWEGDKFTGMANEIGLEAFGRWLGAIKNELLADGADWQIRPSAFDHFDTIEKAVDWLHDNGIRA